MSCKHCTNSNSFKIIKQVVKRLPALLFIWLFTISTFYGQRGANYWVQFTDKNNIAYSKNKPEEFLSLRAIGRRIKNDVAITDEDLPVNKSYIDSVQNIGIRVLYASKWFNSVTIETNDEPLLEKVKKLSFVKSVEKTADARTKKSAVITDKNELISTEYTAAIDSMYYGQGFNQINIENGIFLHKKGYRGKGVLIAIMDVGFLDADLYSSLDSVRKKGNIVATRDFVNPADNIYRTHYHGSAVFAIIAANSPGIMVGTAPEASFLLCRTEDTGSEFPVEEDNWIAAAELADSIGADVINTSLGYNLFSNPVYNHSYKNMDGNSIRISIAARIASSKGILVVVSAGNDGNKLWHYIGAPADAMNILTVGATDKNGVIGSFSSRGPSFDGRIKPDIAAMGKEGYSEISLDNFGYASGTSFSAPEISGLSACLIQAFPDASVSGIMNAIKHSSNKFFTPDNVFGYGIPDFERAYLLLKNVGDTVGKKNFISPNPFCDYFSVNLPLTANETVTIECFNISGEKVFTEKTNSNNLLVFPIQSGALSQGIYIFKCTTRTKTWITKAVKCKSNPANYE
jgi:serine protease AprX